MNLIKWFHSGFFKGGYVIKDQWLGFMFSDSPNRGN